MNLRPPSSSPIATEDSPYRWIEALLNIYRGSKSSRWCSRGSLVVNFELGEWDSSYDKDFDTQQISSMNYDYIARISTNESSILTRPGAARTQSRLQKIMRPNQPPFAEEAAVSRNERPLAGRASFLIKASSTPSKYADTAGEVLLIF
ncbi:hypothetical protein TNCV_2321991 [Trichonephila clavipes]|nr:hypothetical protein TNCV_2321991 [Trichonephila clavipes]